MLRLVQKGKTLGSVKLVIFFLFYGTAVGCRVEVLHYEGRGQK